MNKCPSCKKQLISDHSFCPSCGYDLRARITETAKTDNTQQETAPIIEEKKQIENIEVKGDFKAAFILAISFTTVSVFLWSYVYTDWTFNLDAFLSRLINHSVWILLAPYLISLAFNKAKRPRVYTNLVKLSIFFGIVFLIMGYFQVRYNEDPLTVRLRLMEPCVESAMRQLDKDNLTEEVKKSFARKYCNCIIDKINERDIKLIGKEKSQFWSLIGSKYEKESLDCINGQSSDKSEDLPLPPPKK